MVLRRFAYWRTLYGRFLLVLVLIGIIPLGFVGVVVATLDRWAIVTQAKGELISLARNLASQVDIFLDGVLNDSHLLAALPALTSMDPERQRVLLEEVFHYYPQFARLVVLDPAGAIHASSHREWDVSLPARSSFKSAIEQGQQVWEIGSFTAQERDLLIYTPIRNDQRRVVGVLLAITDLSNLGALVGRMPIGSGGRAFVLDAEGYLLLHPEWAAVRAYRDYTWVSSPSGGRPASSGTVVYAVDGEPYIGGYAPVPISGWTAMVERPERVVLAPAERSWHIALMGLTTTAMLALLLALLLARALTQPIRRLALAAQALGAGYVTPPLPRSTPHVGELAMLMEAFEAMREQVVRREAALRESEEHLRLALTAARMIAWEWDLETDRLRVSATATDVLGLPPDTEFESSARILNWVHPQDAPQHRAIVSQAIRQCGTYVSQFRMIRADNEAVIWVEDRGAVVCNTEGKPIYIRGVMLDITDRQRARAEAEQQRQEAEVLAQLAQTLNASLDLDTVLQRVAEGAKALCGSERALIMLRQEDAEGIVARYQVGYPYRPFSGYRVKPGKGIGGQVLLTGRPWRTANYAEDPRLSKEYVAGLHAGGQVAVVAAPIRIGLRVEGVLYVSNAASRPFTERHEGVLLRLADLAASSIRNAQLYHEAQDEVARRTQAEAQLQTSLHEKEVLLKEIHHRVKNNLQIISSLLSLQAEAVEEPRLEALFADCQHRIQSMALIHEYLYQSSDLAQIDFGAYVRQLVTHLLHSYADLAPRVRLTAEVAEVSLGIDQAIPCGLLLNELVSNCFKHAFPHGRSGELRIHLQSDGRQVTLVVHDTGIGFPAGVDFRHTESLGLQLVCSLAEQLAGTITLERERGTRFSLTFALLPLKVPTSVR